MCRMQLNFSCKQQLQNPKNLVVNPFTRTYELEVDNLLHELKFIKEYFNVEQLPDSP